MHSQLSANFDPGNGRLITILPYELNCLGLCFELFELGPAEAIGCRLGVIPICIYPRVMSPGDSIIPCRFDGWRSRVLGG
jgi:hypothetical protein